MLNTDRRLTAFLIGIMIVGFGAALAVADPPGLREIPDDTLTPGVVASTNQAEVCGVVGGLTYSKRHRQTTPEMKREVERRYGFDRNPGEIDHRLELSLGGADDIRNLWPQPGPQTGATWTFRMKDRLEAYAWRAVCREHTMPLAEAQKLFLPPADWRAAYCHLIGGKPC